MSKKSALLLTFSDPIGDPRPKRAFELLNQMGFVVDIASFAMLGKLNANREFIILQSSGARLISIIRKGVIAFLLIISRLFPFTLFRDNIINFWFRLRPVSRVMREFTYDVILVEDLFFLPVIMQGKKSSKVIFDAREYYPRQREDSLVFRIVEKPIRIYLCKKYLKQCDLFLTVSWGLAHEYFREFGVSGHVIRSTPSEVVCRINETPMNKIRMVHHGVANRNRKLENMIHLVKLLDLRFSLDLYLQGDQVYISELEGLITQSSRVAIKKPVPFNDIIPMLRNYDLGLFYVEPTTFNLAHCLPNKLFEFIQARLMVAIGPSPEMSRIVREFDCGVISDRFELVAMAESLNKLDANRIREFKNNSDKAARQLNWGEEGKILQRLIQVTLN